MLHARGRQQELVASGSDVPKSQSDASRKVRWHIGCGDDVAFTRCEIAMEPAGASAAEQTVFEPEHLDVLVHLEYIVLVARLCADDVSSLHVVGHVFRDDLCFAGKDQPVLVAVVEMPIEPSFARDLGETAARGVAPLRPGELAQVVLRSAAGDVFFGVENRNGSILVKRFNL